MLQNSRPRCRKSSIAAAQRSERRLVDHAGALRRPARLGEIGCRQLRREDNDTRVDCDVAEAYVLHEPAHVAHQPAMLNVGVRIHGRARGARDRGPRG
jgi:hypothetical protein